MNRNEIIAMFASKEVRQSARRTRDSVLSLDDEQLETMAHYLASLGMLSAINNSQEALFFKDIAVAYLSDLLHDRIEKKCPKDVMDAVNKKVDKEIAKLKAKDPTLATMWNEAKEATVLQPTAFTKEAAFYAGAGAAMCLIMNKVEVENILAQAQTRLKEIQSNYNEAHKSN